MPENFEKNITIALTSCGRFQLLQKTIASIGETIDLSKYEKIMTEDSRDEKHITKIKEANKNGFLKGWKIVYTAGSGQKDLYKCHYYALKALYENISTKYVFHCEDDQIFKKTDFDYFLWSYEVLENYPHIAIVLLRDICKDFGLKKTGIKASRYYEILTDKEEHLEGHDVIYFHKNESFSLQPGLRRTDIMKKIMFGFEDFVDEGAVSQRLSAMDLDSVVIKNGVYNHANPIFHSTKNIQNLGFWRYIFSTLQGTIRYRGGLLIKYFKNMFKK